MLRLREQESMIVHKECRFIEERQKRIYDNNFPIPMEYHGTPWELLLVGHDMTYSNACWYKYWVPAISLFFICSSESESESEWGAKFFLSLSLSLSLSLFSLLLDMKMKTLVRVVDIFSVFSLGPPPSVTDELNAFDVFLFCWANPYLFSLTLLQVESGSSLGRPFPV